MPTARVLWRTPINLVPSDIATIKLSSQESKSIAGYVDAYLDKESTDRNPSQWVSTLGKNKRNPNETGIRGEWAGGRHFEKTPDLLTFLANRPWRMADFGDLVLKGKTSRIFDYKTRGISATPEELCESDFYQVHVATKFSGDNYRYLQGFIFCTDDWRNNNVRVVGWMLRDEFFSNAIHVPAGQKAPYQARAYENPMYVFPYRRLHRMSELGKCKSLPISEKLTMRMRVDFKKGAWESVDPYLAGIL